MRTLAALSLLLIVGCQAPPAEMTEAEIARIEASIMEVTDQMSEAWTAFDIERTQSFFHPDRTSFAWGRGIFDYAGHEERLRDIWSSADGQEASWVSRKVEVLSKDLVLFQGSFDLKIFFSDGRVGRYPGTAHYTVLWEPYEGEWKITYGGYTSGGYEVIEGG